MVIYSLVITVFFVVLDRFFKFLAINKYLDEPISIFGNWFQLEFIPNYFIAFSLPLSGIWLNILIFLLILVIFYYIIHIVYIRKKYDFQSLALTIVLLGAISNMLDRFRYGFVIDYLDLEYFTVFNIADIMIVVGFLILVLVFYKNQENNNTE